eukprot:3793057-Amphidinium_carterae.1
MNAIVKSQYHTSMCTSVLAKLPEIRTGMVGKQCAATFKFPTYSKESTLCRFNQLSFLHSVDCPGVRNNHVLRRVSLPSKFRPKANECTAVWNLMAHHAHT